MKVEESVVIHRPPEEVFGFLQVRSNDAMWMGSVVESEWLEPEAEMGLGRRGRMVLKSPRGSVEYTDEVTEYQPGERIAHRSMAGSVKLNTACITEPADGGCRATVTAEADHFGHLAFRGERLARLADPFLAMFLRRGLRSDLARLKDILERDREH